MRIARLAQRDKVTIDVARERAEKREKTIRERYRKLYDIHDLGNDENFNIIIDTTHISPEQVADEIIRQYRGQYPETASVSEPALRLTRQET